MQEEEKRPIGRPSKYDPEYCQKVIEAGNQGFSLTAFAGQIGVCRDTITEWMKVHEDFSLAVKRHAAARTLKLESDLLSAENGPTVTSRIFALKNAAPAEWRDKIVNEHTGSDGGPIQTQSTVLDANSLTWEERQKMREILLAAQERKKEG